MRSCQEHSDREGLKQQSLAKTMHVNHKHYVLPGTSLSPPPLLQSKGAGTCGQITMCQQLHNLLESYDFQMRQVLLPILGRIVIVIYGNPWRWILVGFQLLMVSKKYANWVWNILARFFSCCYMISCLSGVEQLNLYRISGWTCNSSFQAPKM